MTFPTSLPTKITAALEAINNNDSNKFYTIFSSNATIIDEGKTLKGHASIKDFCNKAFISHSASIIFENAIQVKDQNIIQVTMDGDSVADYAITEPFTLYFNFHLQDASITPLLITTWNSSKLTMTAVYVDKADIDNPISTIKIAPKLQPTPQEGWVKVKMQAVGLNYHDIFTMRGLGMRAPRFPSFSGAKGQAYLKMGRKSSCTLPWGIRISTAKKRLIPIGMFSLSKSMERWLSTWLFRREMWCLSRRGWRRFPRLFWGLLG
jgi:hypothetical protein